MRGGFCPLRPALHGFRWLAPLPSARSPSKAGGPVVLPDGRVTRRPRLLRVSRLRRLRVSERRRLQRPPEARLQVKPHRRRRSPPALPEPDPATPSRRRGSRDYEGGRGTGDNLANIKFLWRRKGCVPSPRVRGEEQDEGRRLSLAIS